MRIRIKIFMITWFILMFAALSKADGVPQKTIDAIGNSGYIFAINASGVVKMSDGYYVLRVYDDISYEKETVLLVKDGILKPLETNKYAGEQIYIDLYDLDSDGIEDIVISELFEIGGDIKPEWLIRIYLYHNNGKYWKVFDGVSATRPLFVDLTGDRRLELITTYDPYGFGYRESFSARLYELRKRKYLPINKDISD